MFNYDYLNAEVISGFENYKYSSLDTSPLSNYVMHPFWNQVVRLCPMWVAPNLLTFVGFICCVLHCFIITTFDYNYTSSTLSKPHLIPNYVWFLAAILLFLSHTLDGIDGKQARRTGTSTPLGELFDHGLDSWSTVFLASVIYSVFGRNIDGYSADVFHMYALLWVIFTCFHLSHWEKYNTGIMYLPWGYDIVMVTAILLYLSVSFMGTDCLKFKVLGISPGRMAEICAHANTFIVSLPVVLLNIWNSWKSGSALQSNVLEGLRPIFALMACLVICIVWVLGSPNNILEQDPRCFFFMSGTLYANLSCRLIVAQMSKTRSELLNPFLLPVSLASSLCLLVPHFPLVGELIVLYVLTLVITLFHVHYGICVVRQMCRHFKIDCFSIQENEPRCKNLASKFE